MGNDTIIRFMICATGKVKNDSRFGTRRGLTYINVAVSSGEKMHNSLQLSVDDFVKVEEKDYSFTHNGTMTVGKRGRIKNNRTVDFVLNKEPSLVSDARIILGRVKKNTQLDWIHIKSLLLNLGVYALLRDDLRKLILFGK